MHQRLPVTFTLERIFIPSFPIFQLLHFLTFHKWSLIFSNSSSHQKVNITSPLFYLCTTNFTDNTINNTILNFIQWTLKFINKVYKLGRKIRKGGDRKLKQNKHISSNIHFLLPISTNHLLFNKTTETGENKKPNTTKRRENSVAKM
jgi:hypothetical protein